MKKTDFSEELKDILMEHLKNIKPLKFKEKIFFSKGDILWQQPQKQWGIFYIKYPFIQASTLAYHEAFLIYSYFYGLVRPEKLFCGRAGIEQNLSSRVLVQKNKIHCLIFSKHTTESLNIYPKIYQSSQKEN